jgi:ribosomal protein S18 acetylase RimI-like enzyme
MPASHGTGLATGTKIRRALPTDAPIIGQIRIRGWRAAYERLLPAEILARMSDVGREPQRRQRLRRPPARSGAWVIEEEHRVVGFVLTGPTRDLDADRSVTGEVFAIYVEPDRMGFGLGGALFAHALDDLRAMDYTAASLWVLAGNDATQRFYQRFGFRADGRQQVEELEGTEVQVVRYVRELVEPAGSTAS